MATVAFDLHEWLLRTDADYFSRHALGAPYVAVQKLLYPAPRYKAFLIRKRNGSHRIIQEPRKPLKELQLKALRFIDARAGEVKSCVHGFVKSRSIVSNAERHIELRPRYLLNIDLEDFFPSISFYRVRGVFRKGPFNFSHEVATVLAQLCTVGNGLPQGAPTSPLISNLVCRSLDNELMALARRHRATYTRYADDLTFSFSVREASRLPENICAFDSGLVTLGQELLAIIQNRHHFRVNPAKTRISTRMRRMEVTGITVNEFANVKRSFIDRIRGALNAWSKHGYDKAQLGWQARVVGARGGPLEKRPWSRQTRTGAIPQLKNVLWGKLLYLRMVRGKEDSIYTRLAESYNAMCEKERSADPKFEFSSLPVGQIVRNAADAERAVFVIEWSGNYLPVGGTKPEAVYGQGTAFAYKQSRKLITCDHVLTWRGDYEGKEVFVCCESPDISGLSLKAVNPTTGAAWPLSLAHRDSGRDLAILEISAGQPTHRHFSGLDAPIHKNESGLLVGYPNWSPGRVANQVSAIVQSRYNRSGLARFEISSTIRQGNSGGPFLDNQFRLAGIAQQGATQQSGNDECMCVSELDGWLDGLSLPTAAAANRVTAPTPSP
jgi:RNA-directed DNA polymerase